MFPRRCIEGDEQLMLAVCSVFDGLLSDYDRSVAKLVKSKDWNPRRTSMAVSYAKESAKAFSELAKELKQYEEEDKP